MAMPSVKSESSGTHLSAAPEQAVSGRTDAARAAILSQVTLLNNEMAGHLNFTLPPKRGTIALLSKITCPHCWHSLTPESLLWVSRHAELTGDPVLGSDAASRFLPSRFTVEGRAIDARDMTCEAMACPRCHLTIPGDLLMTDATFMSIIGVPASGKSYFLAAMTWELRRVLAGKFRILFSDADLTANVLLNQAEETLFLQDDVNLPVKLEKTDTAGIALYDRIQLGEQIIILPKPLLFTLKPSTIASRGAPAAPSGRVLCLYDNAGEHFQPGNDSVSSPVTQHMARSRVLMFLYDPLKDSRFRTLCRAQGSTDPQLESSVRAYRQETILNEAANRVRKYSGLSTSKKHDRPLIVIVPKADVWGPLIGLDLTEEPLTPPKANSAVDASWAVDVMAIEAISARVRALLREHAPEFVAAAEDFCQTVIYVPVSALGCGPEKRDDAAGFYVRPRDIKPQWVTVPLLYVLAKWSNGLIPTTRHAAANP